MLILLFAVFGLTLASTPLFAAVARRNRLLDLPNHRSLHVQATPRTGGIGVVLAVLAGCTALPIVLAHDLSRPMSIVLVGAGSVALLGFIDDVRPLPALIRLVVQAAVAVGVVILTGPPHFPPPFSIALLASVMTVGWLVAFTNVYNFMDGSDGMAGGQAVIAGVGWAAFAWFRGFPESAGAGLILAAAGCGFLLYNWQPATVFLGDGGSSFLGFLFAALPLTLAGADWSAIAGAALPGWLFLFDTGLTLGRRIMRGENVLEAHRSHLYQRLILAGMTHRNVALEYMLLAAAGTIPAALLARGQRMNAGVVFVMVVVASGALVRQVNSRERTSSAAGPETERIGRL